MIAFLVGMLVGMALLIVGVVVFAVAIGSDAALKAMEDGK